MIEFSDYPDSGKLRGATEILLVTVSDPGLTDAKVLFPGATSASTKRYGYAFTGMRLSDGAKAYAIKISGTYVLLGGSVGGGSGDGVTFYPSVSPEGIISWTNDGGLPNPEPVNIKGPPGDGLYAFEVRADGHLWMVYNSPTAPNFHIDARGHLIYTFEQEGGT